MDLDFLSRVFSTWKGYCYTYTNTVPESANDMAHITGCLSQVLETNDFISRIARIDGVYYVYLEDHSIDSPDFPLIGEINGHVQGAE